KPCKQVACPNCASTFWGLAQAGGSQMFGRATNFQIPTKLSAGIHPRLRQTARYLLAFCFSFVILDIRLRRSSKPTPKYKLEVIMPEIGEIKNSFPATIAMCPSITK